MRPAEPIQVVLLTQDQCGLCEQAKEVLVRVAFDHPLAVRTVDLASDEGSALAEEGGVLFPPGVLLDGRPFSYGRLSERKLRRELERRHSGQP